MVVGCGLIGSSLARAARANGLAETIIVCDPSADVRARVAALDLADEILAHPNEARAPASLAAVCAPPASLPGAVAASLAALEPDGAAFDVGSVKGALVRALAAAAPPATSGDDARFVPAHPIAGTERSGPEAGFAELFQDRWCILTPRGRSDGEAGEASLVAAQAIENVTQFWRGCGARVSVMEPDAHDALLAATSHAPHLIAYALTSTAADRSGAVIDDIVQYSAGGFRDFTRIAASDPVMWRDVFLANREAVIGALDEFEDRLSRLRALVVDGDGEGLHAAFLSTRSIRAAIVEAGQETDAPDFGRHPAAKAGDDREQGER